MNEDVIKEIIKIIDIDENIQKIEHDKLLDILMIRSSKTEWERNRYMERMFNKYTKICVLSRERGKIKSRITRARKL